MVVVTHDPILALMASRRIVMKRGAAVKIINTTEGERKLFSDLERIDGWLSSLRGAPSDLAMW